MMMGEVWNDQGRAFRDGARRKTRRRENAAMRDARNIDPGGRRIWRVMKPAIRPLATRCYLLKTTVTDLLMHAHVLNIVGEAFMITDWPFCMILDPPLWSPCLTNPRARCTAYVAADQMPARVNIQLLIFESVRLWRKDPRGFSHGSRARATANRTAAREPTVSVVNNSV